MIPKLAVVGPYPPSRCGVASYSRSLASAMSRSGTPIGVLRLLKDGRSISSSLIIGEHRGDEDLVHTLDLLNEHDLVILQHDFGIYGDADSDRVMNIVSGLRVPLITVLHSVSPIPSNRQRRAIEALLLASDATVVLSHSARRVVTKSYDVEPSRLITIPHGAPTFPPAYRSENLHMRPRILSWGLLRSGKGYEWGIAAMADLRDLEPSPDYFIVGQTHPEAVRHEGLSYRRHLERLAKTLNVADRVHFIDDHLDASTLIHTIASADVYLLPYETSNQLTSSVLMEALAAGGPVIATRFAHAMEMLGDGTGLLVNHGDPHGIASAVKSLIRDADMRSRMRHQSLHKVEDSAWSATSSRFVALAHHVLAERRLQSSRKRELPVSA